MFFSTFAAVYNRLLTLNTINEINMVINKNENKNDIYLWLYRLSKFEKKFRINDKHLLTVFCKVREPHIDRKNLLDEFRKVGVAKTCSLIACGGELDNDLTMEEVYNFLTTLQFIPSKNHHLIRHFKTILHRCNEHTLFCLITIIRNTRKNKKLLTKRKNLCLFKHFVGGRKGSLEEEIKRDLNMITPGKPVECMLAQPCKSFDAIDYDILCVEIKYNGERVQLHKVNDGQIACFKRNLNLNQKCSNMYGTIMRALHHVDDIILDCELMGTCPDTYHLIVFDILYLNGKSLMNEELSKRKEIMRDVLRYDDTTVRCIEYVVCENKDLVEEWVREMLRKEAVEGVVIKHWNGVYESKKKKWFKIKSCYFKNVCSADLVVVGGWYGAKDSLSIYLVAAPFYDYEHDKWMFLPVSKVKFSKNNYEHYMKPYKLHDCDWLVNDEHLRKLGKIPDMVAKEPLIMPVWEMEGDFIRSNKSWSWGSVTHNYVSIRLPRFIRVRDDKSYEQSNTIFDLNLLASISNKSFDYPDLYQFFLSDNNIKNMSIDSKSL
ncbi:DNA-ligase [Diatraea saccharalis granulovirus]|uniref:DNA ligase n=1 Tax=Diatraea saccharalis granulovirus TaxID=1675862 RepID=A0A0R7EZ13_9BBAC|nr:DNA-ligase [Diatraea saccharalis granulovirus]AKN80818.1 DNA-ligase [Diatraea saccharalis granulovirus]